MPLRWNGPASVALQSQSLRFEAVRTVEEVPLDVTLQVLYQVDPDLFSDDFLPKIPLLSNGGWSGILQWQTESVLRSLLAGYTWRNLGQTANQQRLERHLTQTLADFLKVVGLKIGPVCLVKTELSINLQQTLIRAEQDSLEAKSRSIVLKQYAQLFGPNLAQAMTQIIRWELLNLLRNSGHVHLLLTTSGLALDSNSRHQADLTHPFFSWPDCQDRQLPLPLPQAGQEANVQEDKEQ